MNPRSPAHRQIEAALKAHQSGNLAEAQRLYRAVLALNASDPQALHGLGVIAFGAGNRDEALPLLAKAALQAPRIAEFRRNYANALAASRPRDVPCTDEVCGIHRPPPKPAADPERARS